MNDQKTGEFTVIEVLRESCVLFFSKNFLVFFSAPFFFSIVKTLMGVFMDGIKFDSLTGYTLWNAVVWTRHWLHLPLSYAFIACGVLRVLSHGSASFSESLSRSMRHVFWLFLTGIVISVTYKPALIMVHTLYGELGWLSWIVTLGNRWSIVFYDALTYCVAAVPFLLCACPFCLAVPALFVEKTGVESLDRSMALTKGYYATVFILLMVAWLSAQLDSLLYNITLPTYNMRHFMLLLGNFLSSVVLTFDCIIGSIAYCRLRVVKEGVNLEDMAVLEDEKQLNIGQILAIVCLCLVIAGIWGYIYMSESVEIGHGNGSRGCEFIKYLGAPRELKSPCDGGVGGLALFLLPLFFIPKRPILFRKKRDENPKK